MAGHSGAETMGAQTDFPMVVLFGGQKGEPAPIKDAMGEGRLQQTYPAR